MSVKQSSLWSQRISNCTSIHSRCETASHHRFSDVEHPSTFGSDTGLAPVTDDDSYGQETDEDFKTALMSKPGLDKPEGEVTRSKKRTRRGKPKSKQIRTAAKSDTFDGEGQQRTPESGTPDGEDDRFVKTDVLIKDPRR